MSPLSHEHVTTGWSNLVCHVQGGDEQALPQYGQTWWDRYCVDYSAPADCSRDENVRTLGTCKLFQLVIISQLGWCSDLYVVLQLMQKVFVLQLGFTVQPVQL